MLKLKNFNKLFKKSINKRYFTVGNALIENCKILVVGGGTGGCAVSAKLTSKLGPGEVIVLDPNDRHYYQPMFTMIGGGMKSLDQSFKPMVNVLPSKAKYIKEKVETFEPQSNFVITNNGRKIVYDILVIGTGLQLDYDKIPGLEKALSIPNGKVCSIYSPKYVNRTYEAIERFDKGNAVFTFPASPVKCPGAPQKIMYIAEHYFRKTNKKKNANIIYNTSLPVIFGVKHYADALWKIVEERDIKVNVKRNLVEVKPDSNVAIFANLDNLNEKFEIEYEMLHAVPPMSAPKELLTGKDLVNSAGFVDVNPKTLQHVKYSNIFAIGDSSSSPNSKTAASAAAQCPIVANHVLATLEGKELENIYDGYASCPLVTGYNSCILAEFDYNLTPLETFPFAQNKERLSMFLMKKDLMPFLYWNLMLNGLWNGPATLRKILSIVKFK